MKKTLKLIKNSTAGLMALALVFAPFGFKNNVANATTTTPNWNASGDYVISLNYEGSDYTHDLSLTSDGNGGLTGQGGYPSNAAHTYEWQLTSGSVSGDDISFDANYTGGADAMTPPTVMHATGTIASDGSMSGNWSDNYQGGSRSGTWMTNSGHAVAWAGSLAAEDFGVVSYDTGLGMLKGYSAGFGLTDATFSGVQAVEVKLYDASGNLLQTNTGTAKIGTDVTGSQISSPFDVSGAFDYATDGFWTNSRQSEYGQSVPAAKVVAKVTLANGKMLMAENTNLTGDASTIYPNPGTGGTIGGTVTGGTNPGVLSVTSIETVDSTATADGTFGNGWKYVFNVTIPSNETNLAMKFSDWMISGGGSSTIPAMNNMRISSAQADNSGATVMVTGAGTYTTPTLHMTGDLNPSMDGMQVKVTVEVAVPAGTVNGAYSTSYGVKTN